VTEVVEVDEVVEVVDVTFLVEVVVDVVEVVVVDVVVVVEVVVVDFVDDVLVIISAEGGKLVVVISNSTGWNISASVVVIISSGIVLGSLVVVTRLLTVNGAVLKNVSESSTKSASLTE